MTFFIVVPQAAPTVGTRPTYATASLLVSTQTITRDKFSAMVQSNEVRADIGEFDSRAGFSLHAAQTAHPDPK
jgi:hypothetical protein